jgi:hypothetical protein
LVPILNQINPDHTLPLCFCKIPLFLYSHLHFHLLSDFFPSGFPPKILYTFFYFLHMCYMPHPSQPLSFDYPCNISVRVQIMNFLIMQFSPASYHFIALGSKYAYHPVPRHP